MTEKKHFEKIKAVFKNHEHKGHMNQVKNVIAHAKEKLLSDFLRNIPFKASFKVIASIGIAAIGVNYFFKWYKSYKWLQKLKSYPKDVVILHEYPRGLHAPNLSSFAVKLETWLRMADIQYQTEFSFEMSEESTSPWITYNCVEIYDTQLAIEYMSRKLDKNLSLNLTDEQKAVSQAFTKLSEQSLRWVILLHRFVYHPDKQETGLSWLWRHILPFKARKAAYYQGYGKLTKDDVYRIGKSDLRSIDDFIGNKKFLMGEVICDADASLFGVLCQVVYHDRGPLNMYLLEYCKNIQRYVETIKYIYWPDWYSNVSEHN